MVRLTRRFADEMDRAFGDFGHEAGWRLPRLFARGRKLFRQANELGMAWAPRIDVHERDGKFIVHADLPGMNKDEVKVELFDDVLTIEGERNRKRPRSVKVTATANATTGRSIAASRCRRG